MGPLSRRGSNQAWRRFHHEKAGGVSRFIYKHTYSSGFYDFISPLEK